MNIDHIANAIEQDAIRVRSRAVLPVAGPEAATTLFSFSRRR